MRLTPFLTSAVFLSSIASAFPSYQSLAGLSRDEVDLFIREHGKGLGAQPPPPVQMDNSSKLVNDPKHPYIAPGPNDLRGPCPGLNTLANHGVSFNASFNGVPLTYRRLQYLDRSGIVTPQDIVIAVQKGQNSNTERILLS